MFAKNDYENDVMTLLLSWQWHKGAAVSTRANRIAKTIRKLRVSTKSKPFHAALTTMLGAYQKGRYSKFFEAIEAVNTGHMALTVARDNRDLVRDEAHLNEIVTEAMKRGGLFSRKQTYYWVVNYVREQEKAARFRNETPK